MTRGFQTATEYLFVLTEAVGWYIAIRVIASTTQRGALTELLAEIESGVVGSPDAPNVHAAALAVREALDGFAGGPSVVVVVAAAFGAFFLSRAITQLRLPRSAAALLGIVSSVLLLNVLLHVALAGDLRIWEGSGLARFIDDPQSPLFAGRGDAEAFIADPNVSNVPGASAAMVVFGMFAVWGRFLFVGRGDIGFDRALRSFSVGLPVVLMAVLVAQLSGVAAGIFALPYFLLAMITLAVANGERSSEQGASLARAAPWAVSAMVTLGLLAAVAMLFGLIAALEVERVFTPLGAAITWVVGWVLLVVITPFAWVVNFFISALFANADPDVLEQVGPGDSPVQPADEDERDPFKWPRWVTAGFKLGAFALFSFGVYYVGRYLFFRRPPGDGERDYAEERKATSTSAGLGDLLRNLIPHRRPRPASVAWLDRHAIYRLFARSVNDAEDRGFRRRPGETPLEFAAVAEPALDAAPLPAIAAEFDRVRYGRHQTTDHQLRLLDGALSEWERTHPATDEVRERVARDAPEDELPPLPPPPGEQPERPRERPEPGTLQ